MKSFLTIFSALMIFNSSTSFANEEYSNDADKHVTEAQEYVEEAVGDKTSEY